MIDVADWKVTRYQKKLVKKVLKSGRLTYGPVTDKLEKEFARLHNQKHALFCDSGTSALTIAIHALKDLNGWKDGDEVIMPSVTFVATLNVITYNNLKPVLVDIKSHSLNIDHKLIEKSITKRTVAIMPVHLLGLPAEMAEINKLAKKHKLKVIEDSCETMFINHPHGDVACYSTYLAHILVTGVGGFITTNNTKLYKYMRSMQFHGRDDSYLSMDDDSMEVIYKRFLFDKQGYSARATELEAALGLGEIKKYKQIIDKRQRNASYLQYHLQDYAYFPGSMRPHAYMMFPMIVHNRDKLMHHLEKNGIRTRTIMPLTNQPIVHKLIGKIENKYPMAKWINEHGILVGCHQYLKRKDLDYIIKTVKDFYENS